MTEDLNLEYYNRLREYLPLDGQTKFGKDFEQDLDEALKNGFDINYHYESHIGFFSPPLLNILLSTPL